MKKPEMFEIQVQDRKNILQQSPQMRRKIRNETKKLDLLKLKAGYITSEIQKDTDKYFRLYQDKEIGLQNLAKMRKTGQATENHVSLNNDEDVDTDDELLMSGVMHCHKDLVLTYEGVIMDQNTKR